MRIRQKIAIVKDLLLFFGGLAGIAYQQVTNQVNITLLLIYTAMTGIPGLTNIIALWRNSATVQQLQQRQVYPLELDSQNCLPTSGDNIND